MLHVLVLTLSVVVCPQLASSRPQPSYLSEERRIPTAYADQPLDYLQPDSKNMADLKAYAAYYYDFPMMPTYGKRFLKHPTKGSSSNFNARDPRLDPHSGVKESLASIPDNHKVDDELLMNVLRSSFTGVVSNTEGTTAEESPSQISGPDAEGGELLEKWSALPSDDASTSQEVRQKRVMCHFKICNLGRRRRGRFPYMLRGWL